MLIRSTALKQWRKKKCILQNRQAERLHGFFFSDLAVVIIGFSVFLYVANICL